MFFCTSKISSVSLLNPLGLQHTGIRNVFFPVITHMQGEQYHKKSVITNHKECTNHSQDKIQCSMNINTALSNILERSRLYYITLFTL